MKLSLLVAVVAVGAGLLPITAAPTPAEAQVLVGRNAARVRRTPPPPPPPREYALTVDEEYELVEASDQVVMLDSMIAELHAQDTAGTLNEEGRTQWRAYFEQRQVAQARIEALTAKRDAAN